MLGDSLGEILELMLDEIEGDILELNDGDNENDKEGLIDCEGLTLGEILELILGLSD